MKTEFNKNYLRVEPNFSYIIVLVENWDIKILEFETVKDMLEAVSDIEVSYGEDGKTSPIKFYGTGAGGSVE